MNYFERLITYEKLKELQSMNLHNPKIKKKYRKNSKSIREVGAHRPKDIGRDHV